MNAYVVAAARPTGFAVLAFGLLLAAYFGVLTVVSGWKFTVSQFNLFNAVKEHEQCAHA